VRSKTDLKLFTIR